MEETDEGTLMLESPCLRQLLTDAVIFVIKRDDKNILRAFRASKN